MGGDSGRSSRGGFKSPFRRKKSGSAGESSSRPPIATQGRPGHSGSGQTYDNDSSNSDRKGRGAEQGRPGSTGKRKKRRFGFGHEGLDGIVVDILGEID